MWPVFVRGFSAEGKELVTKVADKREDYKRNRLCDVGVPTRYKDDCWQQKGIGEQWGYINRLKPAKITPKASGYLENKPPV